MADRNPLTKLWSVVTTAFAIIGFSSLIQNGFSDLLAWKGFIAVVVDSYRSITVPLFDFVFGWLPFSVPMWINDYIVFGSIYGGSAIRAYSSAREE